MWIRLVILFIFVLSLLIMNIPNLDDNDNLSKKLYIFCGVFMFEFIISIATTLYNKKIIDIGKIVKYSLQSSLFAALGYSIWSDINTQNVNLPNSSIQNNNEIPQNMEEFSKTVPNSSSGINNANEMNNVFDNLKLTTMITLLVASGYGIDHVFKENQACLNDCLNMIYEVKSRHNKKK